jgi:secretion/DNA translocation related TadE-like protein
LVRACGGSWVGERRGFVRSGAAGPDMDLDRRQAGSATVLALAFTVLVLLAGLAAVDVGLLVVARTRAQTAADLAALAALTPPGAGAGAARQVAAGNGAELSACACGAGEAVVTVRTRVRMLPGPTVVSVAARARAVLPAFSPTGQAQPLRVGHRPAGWWRPKGGPGSPGRPGRRYQTSGTRVGPARHVAWASPGGIGTTRPSGAGCGASATLEAPGVGPVASPPVCIFRRTD